MDIAMGIRGRGRIDEGLRNRRTDTTTNNTEKRSVQEIRGHTTKSQEEEHLYHITNTPSTSQTRHAYTHREGAPRAEGNNSTYRPGRPSGDGQSERARKNPPRTADETASDRATNQCYIRSNLYNTRGKGRSQCLRADTSEFPNFRIFFFSFAASGSTSERERETNEASRLDFRHIYLFSYSHFWLEHPKRRQRKYVWPRGHPLPWWHPRLDGRTDGAGWRWLLSISFFLELYTPALLCSSAQDMGHTNQGHLRADGGPELRIEGPDVGTEGPKAGPGGIYMCRLGLTRREPALACLARGLALTNKPMLERGFWVSRCCSSIPLRGCLDAGRGFACFSSLVTIPT